MEIISLFEHASDLKDIKMIDLLPKNRSNNIPFNVSYITIPPKKKTTEHRHDESESFLILKGEGCIESEQKTQKVKTGDLLYFQPFESHSLINLGTGTLSFLTIYWRDYPCAFQSATKGKTEFDGPIYITSGPPTPNGDLHLGHLSGPFLGADVCNRYLKMEGKETYNISWSDDFQTGVLDKSEQLSKTPQEVADQFTETIQQTLRILDIEIDIYLRPSRSKQYQLELSDFFYKLWQKGVFIQKSTTEYFEPTNGRFLHEGMIQGDCPHCRECCTGNLCEECGHPHSCLDVVNPLSNYSKAMPITQNMERIFLPLHNYAKDLKKHHVHSVMPSRLRALFDQINQKQLPDFPVTYPSKWGVPVPLKSLSGHVISPWFEMAFAFLFSIQELEKKKNANLNVLSLPHDAKIVHFFGFDNSFYYTVLFPSIYLAAFPSQQLKIDYVYNEFYCLEGSKFSTSRQHIVSDQDLLLVTSPDEIRFYLAYTRPEVNRTNFTKEAFNQFLKYEFSKWNEWLLGLDSKIKKFFNGIIPEAGLWTNEQIEFYASMDHYLNQISKFYSVKTFSPHKAAKLICSFIDECLYFSEGEKHWPLSLDSNPQFRTSITLEVTAANVLAILVSPLMPKFAANLWKQLGNKIDFATLLWPKTPPFATSNAQVNLNNLLAVKVI